MIWDNGHPPRVGTRIFLEKLLRDIHMPSYEKKSTKEAKVMLNKIWFRYWNLKGRIKEALGMKLTPFEDFMVEIRLY